MSTKTSKELQHKEFRMVISRLKNDLGVETDTDLAKALGLERAAFSLRKNRASLPYAEIVAVARERGLSLDWLYGVTKSVSQREAEDAFEENILFQAISKSVELAFMNSPSARLLVAAKTRAEQQEVWRGLATEARNQLEKVVERGMAKGLLFARLHRAVRSIPDRAEQLEKLQQLLPDLAADFSPWEEPT